MALISSSLTPETQPLAVSVPDKAAPVNSGTTTSPATVADPTWMCAAVTVPSIPAQLRSKQTSPWPWLRVMNAVPEASGSPGPGTWAALAVGGSAHGEQGDHPEGGSEEQDATSHGDLLVGAI